MNVPISSNSVIISMVLLPWNLLNGSQSPGTILDSGHLMMNKKDKILFSINFYFNSPRVILLSVPYKHLMCLFYIFMQSVTFCPYLSLSWSHSHFCIFRILNMRILKVTTNSCLTLVNNLVLLVCHLSTCVFLLLSKHMFKGLNIFSILKQLSFKNIYKWVSLKVLPEIMLSIILLTLLPLQLQSTFLLSILYISLLFEVSQA